jgi:hypothetical protein
MDIEVTRFQEDEMIPTDCQQLGETWQYVNKDGSRDRRFANNCRLGVCRYGLITIKSRTGIEEQWMISNADATLAFGNALRS